jgi:hypothetical protein
MRKSWAQYFVQAWLSKNLSMNIRLCFHVVDWENSLFLWVPGFRRQAVFVRFVFKTQKVINLLGVSDLLIGQGKGTLPVCRVLFFNINSCSIANSWHISCILTISWHISLSRVLARGKLSVVMIFEDMTVKWRRLRCGRIITSIKMFWKKVSKHGIECG